MAGGQVCLLVPSRLDFGEKMHQLRRKTATPRCLFGPPDPVETEKLLQEQMQRERERFQRRWNVDLDLLEREIEKKIPEVEQKLNEESRVPPLPSALILEDRSSSDLKKEEFSRKAPEDPLVLDQKICRKPCVKFQKRVRVSGSLKRQTYLTEFWRSRRSLGFVFSKSKSRGISLKVQSVTELLDLEKSPKSPARD